MQERHSANTRNAMVITIDGPAGAGKSTVARMLARHLSFVYLDTGAIYRAVAYQAITHGLCLDDEAALAVFCAAIHLEIIAEQTTMRVKINGEDLTDKIRTEAVSLAASKISAFPAVRTALLAWQRSVGQAGRLVAEGRDMGTVVFPDADFKFFLDADVTKRVDRRYRELSGCSPQVDLSALEKDINRRDRQDRERKTAPLAPAAGAIIIDSSELTAQEVVHEMLRVISGGAKSNVRT